MFSLQPTHPDRNWLIPFTHPSLEWYMYIAAALPSLLLTILLFMDQQITSVIVNRKEHKLKVFIFDKVNHSNKHHKRLKNHIHMQFIFL